MCFVIVFQKGSFRYCVAFIPFSTRTILCFTFSQSTTAIAFVPVGLRLPIIPNYKYNTYPNKQILVTAIFFYYFFFLYLFMSRLMHPERTTTSPVFVE